MKTEIILDLCGGTGAWSEPYRKAGYDVRLITLPDYDVTETLENFNTDGTEYGLHFFPPGGPEADNGLILPYEDIHGILAAPPCTHFSIARTTATTPRDFVGAMKIVRACLNIIELCRIHGHLQWWAMENPTGMLRQFIGNPAMRFTQWEFGGQFCKPTDLWGYFNPPRRLHKAKQPPLSYTGQKARSVWAHPKIPKEIMERFKTTGERRAAVRAITPPGFANAFFKANP